MHQILTNKHTIRTYLPISNYFGQRRLIKKVQARLGSALACTNVVILV